MKGLVHHLHCLDFLIKLYHLLIQIFHLLFVFQTFYMFLTIATLLFNHWLAFTSKPDAIESTYDLFAASFALLGAIC